MGKINFASVDAYIDAQPEAARDVLRTVRAAIVEAVPQAQEQISYAMPFYALPNGNTIAFAGWKWHYSLYCASEAVVREFKSELKNCTIQKGTISFRLSEPVPVDLIRRIARFRAGISA